MVKFIELISISLFLLMFLELMHILVEVHGQLMVRLMDILMTFVSIIPYSLLVMLLLFIAIQLLHL